MKELLLKFCEAHKDVIIPTTFGGVHKLLKDWNENSSKPFNNYLLSIKQLSKIPEVVFGGSISLKALGLLDREPNDIDIMIPLRYDINDTIEAIAEDYTTTSETTTDINGVLIKRLGFRLNGIKVCAFFVAENSFSEVLYDGIKIKVSSVNNTISAKKAYIENGKGDVEKHRQDLKIIANKLCN